jgi:hypothetical protein
MLFIYRKLVWVTREIDKADMRKDKKHSFVNIYLQGKRQLSIHFIILYRTGLSAINAHNRLKIIMREIYDYTQLSIVKCWLFAEIISFNLRM